LLKYSISFSLHKRSSENDTFPVRMRVSFNSNRPEFYTGISMEEYNWNKKNQRSYEKKSADNKELDKLESLIEDIFEEFEYKLKRYPTVPELREAYKVATNKKPPKKEGGITVLELFDLYTDNVGTLRQWAEGRYKKYSQLKNHWEIYQKDALLNDLTESDLIGFIKYFERGPLDYETRKKKAPHRNTSIMKEFADFTSMLVWAAKKEIYDGNLHNSFEPQFKGSDGGLKDLIFLTWDELMRLYDFDFGNEYKNKLRDMFCFLCFTGLRYSDLKKLKKDHVKDNYITVVTEKTIDPLKIDLNDFSRSLVEKYMPHKFPGGLLFPVISSQNFNNDLKVICSILQFNEVINEVYFVGSKRKEASYIKCDVISSHAGRRTFVTNGIAMGIPTDVIMKWTGHKDQRAMKPYIKIVDDLKEKEMQKFNRKK